MVHAGLHPNWSLKKTKRRAAMVEEMLRGQEWKEFFHFMQWCRFPPSDPEGELMRMIFTTAVLTRARYCTFNGNFNWAVRSGKPRKMTEKPWYLQEDLAWMGKRRIVYGHWAAAGLVSDQPHVLGLDTGCVWGGKLTVARLDGEKVKTKKVRCQACKNIQR